MSTEPTNLMLDSYILANANNIKEEMIAKGWNPNYINISSFHQDIHGSKYKDENGEEIITEPTFNWHSVISSQRLVDGEFFMVRVVVLNEEVEINKNSPETMMKVLDEDFKNALETIQEFGSCLTCGANKVCPNPNHN